MIDQIQLGYVYDEEGNRKLHDNYLCVIVNIATGKIVENMQSDCGGNWNDANQWINNEKIIFDGK